MKWTAFGLLFIAATTLHADSYVLYQVAGGSAIGIGSTGAFGVALNDFGSYAYNTTFGGGSANGCVTYDCAVGGYHIADGGIGPFFVGKIIALTDKNTVLATDGIAHVGYIDPAPTSFSPSGLNDSGELVGTAKDPSTGNTVGVQDINGIPTTFSVPGSISTSPTGVNDAGQIVGYFESPNSVISGFIDTNGIFTTVAYPGASQTYVTAVSNNGVAGGYYLPGGTSSIINAQPFTYSNGVFHSVTSVNTAQTPNILEAVNNSGDLLLTQTSGNISGSLVYLAVPTPEIDANSGASAIALLAGALLILRGRRVRQANQ